MGRIKLALLFHTVSAVKAQTCLNCYRTASAMKVEIVKIDSIPVKILHIFFPFKFYNSKVYLKDPNGNFQTYHKKGGN